MGVWIAHCRGQQIGRGARISSFIFDDPPETLVNRQADLIYLLAVDHHRLQPARDKGFRYIRPTHADDFDLVGSTNSLFLLQLHRNLPERLRGPLALLLTGFMP